MALASVLACLLLPFIVGREKFFAPKRPLASDSKMDAVGISSY